MMTPKTPEQRKAESVRIPDERPVLCVDLDGTLVRSDLLIESILLLVKQQPVDVLKLIWWFLRGKAAMKAELAARVTPDPAVLPYHRELLRWLEDERLAGRRLWLCTAANERIAARVAAHLGIFEGVLASSSNRNLSGAAKADRLVSSFGGKGFDYCGNAWQDLAVWRCAHAAIIVSGGVRLRRDAARLVPVLQTFPRREGTPGAIVRALRLHQWLKNVLVLAPVLAAHRLNNLHDVQSVSLALIAFCLCASSAYVLNDLLDLEADRVHPTKSKRPFACGALSLRLGGLLAPALLIASMVVGFSISVNFLVVLTAYYAITIAYSALIKRIVLLDVVVLAGLYTLRVVGGAVAVQVELSFWMFLFSIFLFLSLAFVKRYTELDALRRRGCLEAAGRRYEVEDIPSLHSLGTAAGYASVLVLASYLNSPEIEGMYSRPRLLWALPVLLLFWISRVWMKAQRSEVHDDPLVFALRDLASLILGLLAGIAVGVAV